MALGGTLAGDPGGHSRARDQGSDRGDAGGRKRGRSRDDGRTPPKKEAPQGYQKPRQDGRLKISEATFVETMRLHHL